MKHAYPGIKNESQNVEIAMSSGFDVLGVHRLPARAWWNNYYGPLRQRIREIRASAGQVMQQVIGDTEEEMAVLEKCEHEFGYTYYVMRAS